MLGKLYALDRQGDDIALSLCRKAVALDDLSWENLYRQAFVEFQMGLLAEAQVTIEKCMRLNRKAVDALWLAEQVYMQSGKSGKARNMHKKLIMVARTNQDAVGALQN